MPRVILRPAAEVDLLLIWDFIARDGSVAADNYVKWLTDKLDVLVTQPYMGRARGELKPKLRSFTAGNHIAFYYPLEDGVAVERILDGRQDIRAILAMSS